MPVSRRWFQFGLRSLLIVTTLAACACGWLAWKIQQSKATEARVALLEQLHADVYYDYRCDAAGNVSRDYQPPPAPEWLQKITTDTFLATVQRVEFHNGVEFDPILTQLQDLPEVNVLDVSRSDVDDVALQRIGAMTNLTVLDLSGTKITENGLANLRRLKHLKSLSISVDQLTDVGLKELENWPDIVSLNLDYVHLNDASLSYLEKLAKLEELSLNDTLITDAGLPHLLKLPRLEKLHLYGTKVTDAGLKQLEQMTQLKELTLDGYNISDQAATDLGKRMPNTKIIKFKIPVEPTT